MDHLFSISGGQDVPAGRILHVENRLSGLTLPRHATPVSVKHLQDAHNGATRYEIKYIPYQKGVLKDISSPMGCSSPVGAARYIKCIFVTVTRCRVRFDGMIKRRASTPPSTRPTAICCPSGFLNAML